jgi:hypothetical protein
MDIWRDLRAGFLFSTQGDVMDILAEFSIGFGVCSFCCGLGFCFRNVFSLFRVVGDLG